MTKLRHLHRRWSKDTDYKDAYDAFREEFDLARNKVKVRGIVGSTDEAQAISAALDAHECFEEVKIGEITQVVNETRQKYSLEFDVNCDAKAKKKKTTAKSTDAKEGKGE